jgi:hypothetical protein
MEGRLAGVLRGIEEIELVQLGYELRGFLHS